MPAADRRLHSMVMTAARPELFIPISALPRPFAFVFRSNRYDAAGRGRRADRNAMIPCVGLGRLGARNPRAFRREFFTWTCGRFKSLLIRRTLADFRLATGPDCRPVSRSQEYTRRTDSRISGFHRTGSRYRELRTLRANGGKETAIADRAGNARYRRPRIRLTCPPPEATHFAISVEFPRSPLARCA